LLAGPNFIAPKEEIKLGNWSSQNRKLVLIWRSSLQFIAFWVIETVVWIKNVFGQRMSNEWKPSFSGNLYFSAMERKLCEFQDFLFCFACGFFIRLLLRADITVCSDFCCVPNHQGSVYPSIRKTRLARKLNIFWKKNKWKSEKEDSREKTIFVLNEVDSVLCVSSSVIFFVWWSFSFSPKMKPQNYFSFSRKMKPQNYFSFYYFWNEASKFS
jgi:hypothetical protein